MSYPCFLKPSCLTASKGCSYVRSEAELRTALAKLKPLVTPFFKGYSEFFRKYLDLEKFPLAVENIAVLEELVESGVQYSTEACLDGHSKFTFFKALDILLSPKKQETILAFVEPVFSLDDASVRKLTKFTEDMARRFDLRNTFFNVEVWKHGDEFTLVEVNSRCTSELSDVYEAAVHLACGGKIDTLTETKTSRTSGMFMVYTWGEGKAKDFVDFDYARTGSISDGVYNNGGLGAKMYLSKNSALKQTSSNGLLLGCFFIEDNNVNRMLERAKKVADRLLLRPEDRDVVEFPKIDCHCAK